eukprot:COSAG05_NODE_2831_length_2591_cov_1.839486_1_plen_63_part_00
MKLLDQLSPSIGVGSRHVVDRRFIIVLLHEIGVAHLHQLDVALNAVEFRIALSASRDDDGPP